MEGKTLALQLAQAAYDKQAENVVVLDVRGISGVADYFLLCTASNSRLLDAVQNHLQVEAKKRGVLVLHSEGSAGRSGAAGESLDALRWVLMDCGEVVVHIMDGHTREFYRLEHLWADAPRIDVEDTHVPANPAPQRSPRY